MHYSGVQDLPVDQILSLPVLHKSNYITFNYDFIITLTFCNCKTFYYINFY